MDPLQGLEPNLYIKFPLANMILRRNREEWQSYPRWLLFPVPSAHSAHGSAPKPETSTMPDELATVETEVRRRWNTSPRAAFAGSSRGGNIARCRSCSLDPTAQTLPKRNSVLWRWSGGWVTMPLQRKLLVLCNLSIVPCDGEEGENWQQWSAQDSRVLLRCS